MSQTEWQPIETAPFGEDVLAFFPAQSVKGRRLRGYMSATEDFPPPESNRWVEEFSHTEGGIFMCVREGEEYEWELSHCEDNYYWPTGTPTHWMPLPKSPPS